jgi:hypothetical protein
VLAVVVLAVTLVAASARLGAAVIAHQRAQAAADGSFAVTVTRGGAVASAAAARG